MELAREKSFQCHRMLKKKIKFRREEQNKHLLLHDCKIRRKEFGMKLYNPSHCEVISEGEGPEPS